MYRLAIDTTTEVCSVALFNGSNLIASRVDYDGRNHARLLSVFVNEVLAEAGVSPDAIVLSEGPGSYTGLRIGAATAKGLCFGYDIPLIPISTLQLIAAAAEPKSEFICPLIDARRMEVYTALFKPDLTICGEVTPLVVDSGSFAEILKEHTVTFCGNGAEKCKGVINSHNAVFADGIVPLAANAMKVVSSVKDTDGISGTQLAYYEPFYLKEFQATVSKNKLC